MIGFEDDYEAIEESSRWNRMAFGEWIFFAFSMEPNSVLCKALGKTVHFKDRSTMKDFAYDLLENGEVIFAMSEKFRSAGGIAR